MREILKFWTEKKYVLFPVLFLYRVKVKYKIQKFAYTVFVIRIWIFGQMNFYLTHIQNIKIADPVLF